MRLKSTLIFTAVFLCMVIYAYFAIRTGTGPEFGVSIDLSRPISTVWPCEVSIVGDNGEKGLRIGPKVGRGWRGEAGGQASYRFFIPEDGKYHIWAYCLWYDECANAIFAKIDDLDKAIVGNDPVYNEWHWVRGFDVRLKKGTHGLILSNHSDHIALQKIVFSNSASTGPQETGIVFSDIFYDGFDGCDQGNFTSWQQISGSWLVQNPDSQTCLIENALIGESVDKAFIIYQNDNWENYCLDISVKLLPSDLEDQSVGICFGIEDPNSYHQLRIGPVQSGNNAWMTVLRKTTGKSITLGEFELPWKHDLWHQVQISITQNTIEIKIDDSNPVQILSDCPPKGGIGLMLQEKTTAYFDDVHVRQITKTKDK